MGGWFLVCGDPYLRSIFSPRSTRVAGTGKNVAFRRKVVFVEAGRSSTKIAGMKLERPLGGKANVFMQSVCRC